MKEHLIDLTSELATKQFPATVRRAVVNHDDLQILETRIFYGLDYLAKGPHFIETRNYHRKSHQAPN
jgi:hypothetical protein